MQRAREYFRQEGFDLTVLAAPEPASQPADVNLLRSRNRVTLPSIPLTPAGLALTEGRNQMPTTLLFRGDRLIDRRLGAQTFDELRDWVVSSGRPRVSFYKNRKTKPEVKVPMSPGDVLLRGRTAFRVQAWSSVCASCGR